MACSSLLLQLPLVVLREEQSLTKQESKLGKLKDEE